MAHSRTLQQLVDAVVDRADLPDPTVSGVRHTSDLIVARLNRAIERWYELVADAGSDEFLASMRTATNPSSVRDTFNFAPQQYILQPLRMARLRGIDVYQTNGKPIPMMPADELERDDAFRLRGWWNAGGTGLPVFYRVGGTNDAFQGLIQIFPWADAVYTVDIRYIPNWQDADLVTNPQIDFVVGGAEYVVNDAALQTFIKDGQGNSDAAKACRAWNAELEAKFKFELACRTPVNKMDTRERRRELMDRANPFWRFP